MRRIFLILSLLVFFTPHSSLAASADLGFKNKSDIFFSTNTFIIGQTIRVYASVHNFGDVDVAGYVSFMQGMVEIGNTQIISVRADGQEEEVYVDFVVPEGDFNIRAEIKGTDPVDTNTANDIVLSPLETPIADADGDTIQDATDNCVSVSNSAQTDTDGDGQGNACDSDDDNDTLSDSVETEIGLNPLAADSDSDGVSDADDYAPMDASIAVAPVAPVVVVEPTPVAEQTTQISDTTTITLPTTDSDSDQALATTDEEAIVTDKAVGNGAALSDLQISPNAIFTYEQTGWNSYTFAVRGAAGPEGERYAWDFGDGVTSNRSEITHTYRAFGDYTVKLTVTDDVDQTSSDSTSINISFFHIENPYLQILLAILAVLCATSIGLYLRVSKRSAL